LSNFYFDSRRVDLPLFVYPDGVRPKAPARLVRKRKRPDQPTNAQPQPTAEGATPTQANGEALNANVNTGTVEKPEEGMESSSKRQKTSEVVEVNPEKHESWGLDNVGNAAHVPQVVE